MKRLQTISHIFRSTKGRIRKNRDTARVLFAMHTLVRRAWALAAGRWGKNTQSQSLAVQSSFFNLRSSTSALRSQLILITAAMLFTLSSLLAITYTRNAHVSAASANTINFQARLLTASGAVVPDGAYNVEFKLYDTAAAGGTAQGVCSLNSSTDDCWWIESRTGANKVVTKNGYLTVALGDTTAGGTAFGANVPWD